LESLATDETRPSFVPPSRPPAPLPPPALFLKHSRSRPFTRPAPPPPAPPRPRPDGPLRLLRSGALPPGEQRTLTAERYHQASTNGGALPPAQDVDAQVAANAPATRGARRGSGHGVPAPQAPDPSRHEEHERCTFTPPIHTKSTNGAPSPLRRRARTALTLRIHATEATVPPTALAQHTRSAFSMPDSTFRARLLSSAPLSAPPPPTSSPPPLPGPRPSPCRLRAVMIDFKYKGKIIDFGDAKVLPPASRLCAPFALRPPWFEHL
jgi:hypothetical protein